MLTTEMLRDLEWHPFKHSGRVENLAVKVLPERPLAGGYYYLMGCGHRSVPNRTVCERGCMESPNWSVPVIRHPEWDPYLKRAFRADPTLPRRLGMKSVTGW